MRRNDSGDPRGAILMVSVLLLTLLSTLGMGMLSSSLNENTITKNDINAQRALAVAEAGIAHARKLVAANLSTTSLSQRLAGATAGSPEVQMTGLVNLASLGANNGTYSAWVVNNLANYKGTMYLAEATPDTDADKMIWIRSVGSYRNASRTVRVLVNFNTITDPPAAITLVDGANPTQLTAGFTGNSFLVNGNDTSPPDMAGACGTPGAAKHGISVNSAGSNNVIASALSAQQEDNVEGQGFLAGAKGVDPKGSYANNGTYSRGQLQALATSLLAQATPIPAGNNSDNYGTATAPGIFKATADTTLLGNGKGYGILVVTEDLQMQGNFKWEGLILVVGKGSFHVTGSDSIAYGAVLVANTEANGTTNLEVAGNGGVYYSSQAICRVQNMMPSSSVIAWEQRE
ncbi:MAG: hypothetical protein WC713_06450 [Candidatus Methylomirabilota bacterium]